MPTRNNRVTPHSQRKRVAAVQPINSQVPVRNRYESNRQKIVREKQELEAARRSAAATQASKPESTRNSSRVTPHSQRQVTPKPKPTYGSRVTPHSQRQASAKQSPKPTAAATPKPAAKKVAKPATKKVAKKKSAFFTNREGRKPRGKMAALERRRARTAAAKKNK
jgi:hypothetical protein